MTERVALITGGAKGIGKAVALDLAAQGWSVAVCYRTSEREAEETRDAIERQGVRGLAVRAAVSAVRFLLSEDARYVTGANIEAPCSKLQEIFEVQGGKRARFPCCSLPPQQAAGGMRSQCTFTSAGAGGLIAPGCSRLLHGRS